MNLPRLAVERKALTNFLVFLLAVGGVYSYFNLGQLEDPDFTVKTAVVITQYPGATPQEVELEVTDRIETALQEMPQLYHLTSYSRAGLSIIKVEMQQEFWADRLPQVWDEMRKKIRDVTSSLPPGAMKPEVSDDFSFVFGFVLAVTGDGYTYAELEDHAKQIRKELSLVPGVSRADLWGAQPKVIYLDVSESQLSQLRIIEWEDPIIVRYQRRRQASVQASPKGVTFPTLRASVIDEIEAIELPPGYTMYWDGEAESTISAQTSLIPGAVPAVVIMAIIMVALFNALRPPLVIALTIPFAIIGITAVLLPTRTPFGFMALLGAMSLAGLMIKNAIVLIDEINANRKEGKSPYDATVDAGLSRVRPVVLGAATTVLGVIPLLQDAFWVSMAMTIMAGLTFGTVLTMVLVPVLYATLHGIATPTRT